MAFSSLPAFIGDYTFINTIGTGAFSVVKKARIQGDEETYAIKCIPKQNLVEDEAIERFKREALILNKMEHPNIIKILDFQSDENYVYLVMEYFNGYTLLSKNDCYSENETRIIAKQVMSSIEYMHDMDVAHRDIKPENVLIDDEMHVKMIDFGFSRTGATGQAFSTPCGSPIYAAPEVLSGKPYNGKCADMWSFGVLIFQLLSGRVPWVGRNQTKVYEQIMDGNYSIPDNFSRLATDIIQKLLRVKEEERLTVHEAISHPWIETVQVKRSNSCRSSKTSISETTILNSLKTYPPGQSPNTFDVLKKLRKNSLIRTNTIPRPVVQGPTNHRICISRTPGPVSFSSVSKSAHCFSPLAPNC